MRGWTVWVVAVGCALVTFGSMPQPARADVYSFASGVESNGGNKTCFHWSNTAGSVGLSQDNDPSTCNRHYFVPLYWRNFLGASVNRTITLRGRRATSAAAIDCNVMVFDAQGMLLAIASKSFPVTGTSYTSIDLTVNNIVSSGTSFIACTQTPGDTWLTSVTWSP